MDHRSLQRALRDRRGHICSQEASVRSYHLGCLRHMRPCDGLSGHIPIHSLSRSVCFFWFGWTSRPSVHWIVPILGSPLFPIAGLILLVSFILPVGADAAVLWLTYALRRMRCLVSLRTRTQITRRVYSQGTILFALHSTRDSRCLELQCILI